MARTSPAVERAVALLNFLARHEDESFTLSELARRLDMSKSTGHTLLATLVQAGYVLRDAEGAYLLGPAIVPLGEAATAHHRVVAIARREMLALSEELDLECVLTTVVEGAIMVLGRCGPPKRTVFPAVPPPQRWPLLPPIGTIFVAWWDPVRIDRWLEDAGRALSEPVRQHYRGVLAEVRRRGFSVAAISADRRPSLAGLMRASTPESEDLAPGLEAVVDRLRLFEGYNVRTLDPATVYDVSTVSGAVFDRDGAVLLAVTVQDFARPLTGGEIERVGRRLLARTESITRAAGGRSRLVR
jgi:DNA-binding IclR family transcriptional regulator